MPLGGRGSFLIGVLGSVTRQGRCEATGRLVGVGRSIRHRRRPVILKNRRSEFRVARFLCGCLGEAPNPFFLLIFDPNVTTFGGVTLPNPFQEE